MRHKVRCVYRRMCLIAKVGASSPQFAWDARWCPEGDSNPHALSGATNFKSAASADFAIRACFARAFIVADSIAESLFRIESPFSVTCISGDGASEKKRIRSLDTPLISTRTLLHKDPGLLKPSLFRLRFGCLLTGRRAVVSAACGIRWNLRGGSIRPSSCRLRKSSTRVRRTVRG